MMVRGSDLQSNALDMQSTESVLLHGMAWWTLTIVRVTRLKNALIKELISCHTYVARESSDVRGLDTMTNCIPSPYSQDSRFVSSPIDRRITYVFHYVYGESKRIWYIQLLGLQLLSSPYLKRDDGGLGSRWAMGFDFESDVPST